MPDVIRYSRADGRAICAICVLPYHRHPYAREYPDWQGNLYLRRICDGRLVKL